MSENITKSENNSQNNKNVTKKRKINGQQSQQQSSQQSTTQSTPSHQRSDQNQRSSGGQSSQQWTRLTGAPAWDLAPNINQNQTFTGRCRLFVANLPQNVSEESLRSLFGEFGQISDIYIGKGNQFAFIKMDTKHNAELAKQQLDGKPFEGRTLRVRLAAHASAIRVTQLPPFVSNELLSLAFSSFGVVERAIVSADDRGRSLNEGIVEFARKSSSQAAIKKCQNECLLMSATPIPVCVQPLESRDEEEGVPEKSVIHLPDYRREREIGPRFAEPHSLEWEMARKWKQLSQIEQQRKEGLDQEFKELREGLKQQMESFKIEETVKQLREQLLRMESESKKLCEEREQRLEIERRRELERQQRELMLRQQESELLRRNQSSEDLNGLRRQESELRQQANQLQQLLDRQEQALRSMAHSNDVLPQMDSNIFQTHSIHQTIQQQSPLSNQFYSNSNQSNQRSGIVGGLHPSPHAPPPPPQTLHQNPLYSGAVGAGVGLSPHMNRGPHMGGGSGGAGVGGVSQGMQNYNKRNRRF